MAKDPAFLFYPGDFNTGTQFFTDEQVGKYMRLLMAQHQHGHLQEKHMIFICKSYDNDIFSKFVQDADGLYYNERLEFETNKRKNYTLSRSKNKEGKKKRKSYENHMTPHMENRNRNKDLNKDKSKNTGSNKATTTETTREPQVEICPTFDDFWNLYDKKVDRPKCEAAWKKVIQKDREAIMDHIPTYVLAEPDKKFRKDPYSYLYNKAWQNEIINSKPQTNGNYTTRKLEEIRAGVHHIAITYGEDAPGK